MTMPDHPPNVFDPHFDEPREHPGFSVSRARVGRQAGSVRLGASVWELPAGAAAYPYHAHLGEEEVIVVLAGHPSLRTPEGRRELEPGEVVAFVRGEPGAHQLANRTAQTVTFLALSTNGEPDIVLYPDAGKVGAIERRPDGGGFAAFFFTDDAVDYWDGVDA
ncbi:MAG: cupin domain-containing protein [Solirubrobacteraceae bacterium]|jgi:uncharacterized cupin superfamily protein